MSFPIIILLERHWDVIPKQVLINALPFLKTFGYDTLCFESPSDLDEKNTIAGIESTIQFIEDRFAETNQHLKSRGMSFDPSVMDYSALEQFLFNYVSSRYSKEMALWFKELPGHKQKFDLVQRAKKENITICGIDLPSSQLEPINSLESQNNCDARVSGIIKLDKQRTLAFKKNLVELQQKGKGVIFVVGQSHYKQLVEELAKESLLNNILFLHPYAGKCLDNNYIDYNLSPCSNTKDISLIELMISTPDEMNIFSKFFKSTLNTFKSISIDPTSSCTLLSDKTKLEFKAFKRPNHQVDCYHFFNDPQTIADTLKKLEKIKAPGFFTFFKNKMAYRVPNVNTADITSKIQEIG